MSFEFTPSSEHEHDNVEYEMVVGQLRGLFADAVVEQASTEGYFRMFTLLEGEEEGAPPLARFRLMDSLQAEMDLRSGEEGWSIDVALPLEESDVTMPRLSESQDYFVAFAPEEDGSTERVVTVRAESAEQDLRTLHTLLPHFMSRVLVATVVPMKKSS